MLHLRQYSGGVCRSLFVRSAFSSTARTTLHGLGHADTTTTISPASMDAAVRFALPHSFVNSFADKQPPFGFNGLGELVFHRTYSRQLTNGKSGSELWHETVARVVNGTYTMQKQWISTTRDNEWDEERAQRSAQNMYERMFEMKFLPPGRGLWAMGSPLTLERGLYAALNNCAFVSTENLDTEMEDPFCFLMEASMLGVGTGFDTKGAHCFSLHTPQTSLAPDCYVVEDSREGWVLALRKLLASYFREDLPRAEFDYSQVRPAGVPIKGFGGFSSGPETLRSLLEGVRELLDARVGESLSVSTIVDIMNLIGKCVVAGNVRQTAEIAFGEDNEEFLDLKNYDKNPHRASYGWASNNSVFARVGMDYKPVAERIIKNGEPGFAWLSNMQAFSRMQGGPDHKDRAAQGGNPCLEQTLESYELCCLVETFPANHSSLDDYLETLKVAFLYAKTVSVGQTQWEKTNRVMRRNRRIGTSMSGIAQFVSQPEKGGLHELQHWCESGYAAIQRYDTQFSNWLGIPTSIKTTSIKPSGTVSLLAGATPGMHYPESRFYIRRVRVSASSELLEPLIACGYPVEPAVEAPNTVVVEIPVDAGDVRTSKQVGMWEQLELAAFLQRHWADNQVSCTVTFDPEIEGPQLAHALDYFQYRLKGVSFLPRFDNNKTAYAQMPYEEISEQQFQQRAGSLKKLDLSKMRILNGEEPQPDRFCDGDTCGVDL